MRDAAAVLKLSEQEQAVDEIRLIVEKQLYTKERAMNVLTVKEA